MRRLRKSQAAGGVRTVSADTIVQVKVWLDGVSPMTWLRVRVPGSITRGWQQITPALKLSARRPEPHNSLCSHFARMLLGFITATFPTVSAFIHFDVIPKTCKHEDTGDDVTPITAIMVTDRMLLKPCADNAHVSGMLPAPFSPNNCRGIGMTTVFKKTRIQEFLAHLDSLYKDVQKWLPDSVKTHTKSVNLTEEIFGSYTAQSLEIESPDHRLIATLRPIGAGILGALGRVDLVGTRDTQIIVYYATGGPTIRFSHKNAVGKESATHQRPLLEGVAKEGWYWRQDRRLGRARPLDKQLFCDLLREVSDYEF